ncbi:hypothetical protein GYMLUDRAFT_183314, partial [Collybiopsis luxurians FD-317 M1]
RIGHVCDSQKLHMPFASSLLTDVPDFESLKVNPHKIPLLLPSSLDNIFRAQIPHLCKIEAEIREAQCSESLSKLRGQLRARQVAYVHTSQIATGQKYITSCRELQQTIELRIKLLRTQYKNAHKCFLILRGPGVWQETFQELKGTNIRSVGERALSAEEKEMLRMAQLQAGVTQEEIDIMLNDDISNMPTVPLNPVLALGESKRTLSWIWYTVSGSEINNKSVNASLRVEWCKARARAQRSREELQLVEEEMRRVLEFTSH